MTSYAVELDQVAFSYLSRRDAVGVLSDFTLKVRPGEFVSLVGPSGCGKSTVFKLVAGLLAPAQGAVQVAGKSIVGSKGHVALMPQRDLLLPWRSVRSSS